MNATATIALAGASGSHPALLQTLAKAIGRVADSPARLIIDMSAFDRRGRASYASVPGTVVRPVPEQAAIGERFATAAPNIVLAGGIRSFRRLIAMFDRLLSAHKTTLLLVCHSWGLPEQALIRAARARGITVIQIDEGPFSLPLRGTRVAETSRATGRAMLRILRAIGAFPPRDMTGALIDKVLVTAPGRKTALIDRGVSPDRIEVVPPPRFDRLADIAARWPDRPRGDRSRILWVHQPFRADGKVAASAVDRMEEELAAALALADRSFPLQIHVRLHPRSGSDERERVVAMLCRHGLALSEIGTTGVDLYDDILRSDAAVGFYSSALLEAAVCTMPTLSASLPPGAFRQRTEAQKSEAMKRLGIPTARGRDEMAALLVQGLRAGRRDVPQILLDEEIGWLNGCGADRVAEILVDAAYQSAAAFK